MIDPEKEKEIFEVLKSVAEQFQSGPSEGSLRQYAKGLVRYHHPNLFRLLWKIPQFYKEFPTKMALESAARKSLGLEPAKGLNEELIEKNSEQLLAEGISPENVEKGEKFLKRIIGVGDAPPKSKEETLDDVISDLNLEF